MIFNWSLWIGTKLGLFQTIGGNDEIEGTIHVSCIKKAKLIFDKTNRLLENKWSKVGGMDHNIFV